MAPDRSNSILNRYAWLTALATLVLIAIGGLVTSHGAGMAVPDWPNSNGYNMFLFPVSQWVGGILYEHTHRLVATIVGTLVVALTRWLGGRKSRVPLVFIGLAEILAGALLLRFAPELKGAGHFLWGIGGVVLLAGAVWVRNEPAVKPLPVLGWVAFAAVQVQGLLGGLRVVLLKDELGIFHAGLAQLFFVLLCVIAWLTRARWRSAGAAAAARRVERPAVSGWWFAAASIAVFGQLNLGASMRHQHAGLAIPDFPLAYGKLWPAMDPSSIELYNAHRLEIDSVNPITAAQVALQMAHRLGAVVILLLVAACWWSVRGRLGRNVPLSRGALVWLVLILAQALLGAATIWSDKAADVATAHVVLGAIALATGSLLSLSAFQYAGVFCRVRQSAALTPDGLFVKTELSPGPAAATGVD